MSDAKELAELAARSEARRVELAAAPTEPAPPSSWLSDVAPALVARFRAEEVAAEEHARSCGVTPCERCDRHRCCCGAVIVGSTMCPLCSAISLQSVALEPTVKSIPKRFAWAVNADRETLESRVRGPATLVLRGLTAPPSTSLLFTGPTGAGKTSLACAMLVSWVRADLSARRGALFVEASWLSRARARHKLGQGEAELVEQCLAAPLLLLDDLGQEREDRDGCITDVVYGRSSRDLPIWVTCGLPGGDLESFAEHLSRRYDGGFVRRILEHGKRVELGKK